MVLGAATAGLLGVSGVGVAGADTVTSCAGPTVQVLCVPNGLQLVAVPVTDPVTFTPDSIDVGGVAIPLAGLFAPAAG